MVAALLVVGGDTPGYATTEAVAAAPAASDRTGIARIVQPGSPIAAFYASRGYRRLWPDEAIGPVIERIASARDDGIDPARFPIGRLKTLARNPARGAALDVALSEALVAYLVALRSPPPSARMIYVDAELAPVTDAVAILQSAADTPSAIAFLARAMRMHPLYEVKRAELQALRRSASGPGGRSEHALLADMDRLRALPADPGRRHILVDTAAAQLSLYDGSRSVDTMRVIVGKPGSATPVMAGLIRYAVRDPYWNLPPDLIRARAAEIVRHGPDLIARENLELLSGWEPDAITLDPSEIDWGQVARGERKLRMRQMPGPDNMMGAVKFMLPNRLGIYLHDTPDKGAFARTDRRLSSGCVRLEDAERLSRWLFAGNGPPRYGLPEERADLPEPVPVYIVHLTSGIDPGRFTA